MRRIPVIIAATLGAFASPLHAERGADGELVIAYWQAISVMTPYRSNGTKDIEAASLVLEPLARYDETGAIVPYLAEEIPTLENGGISADMTAITWRLKAGLFWSDGTPVTAGDAVFTWRYCTHPDGGCAQAPNFAGVERVEALDERTIRVVFAAPSPFPYGPFVGAQSPLIQAAQFADCLGAEAPGCADANTHPVGTGPFVVEDFRPNDAVVFAANPRYRDASKPRFARVRLEGGGDAAAAAGSVLVTGEADYAWNAQVELEILAQMQAGGRGEVISAFGTLVERIMVNQTDPDPALGEARSTTAHPHPILTDPRVVRALSLAIDREILVEAGYGGAAQVSCNLVPAPEAFASPNNDWCVSQALDGARRLLEAAGWEAGADGVRRKAGMRLSLDFVTSANAVRAAAQALIAQWWRAMGVEVTARNVDAAVFFGGEAESPDTFQRFYADLEMYADSFDGTDPEKYLGEWVCDEIPSPQNRWQGVNTARYCDPAYDALHAELGRTSGPEERGAIAIRLNDMIVNAGAIIPLLRRGRVSAKANSLDGVRMNPWDSELWNIADWHRRKD